MKIAVFPEGPIAYDGKHYRYSKGERLYLDSLARFFDEIVIVSMVFKKCDKNYQECVHSAFTAKNIRIIELPSCFKSNVTVIGKAFHFFKIFFTILFCVRGCDVFYLFVPSYPSAFACLVAKIKRIPYMVYAADDWVKSSHGMFIWDDLRGGWFYRCYLKLSQWMEKRIGKGAAFSVTAGQQLYEKYIDFGKPVEQTIPRITLRKEHFFYREDTCNGENIFLINVAGFVYNKAQHVLVKCFSDLYAENSRLRLKFIGSGPREESLKKLSKTLGVEKSVSFTGYINEEAELYEHYKNADVFVLSSVSEGFPRVLYEAMAHSLPIVTTDCGGIPYLIANKINGMVVPTSSEEKLKAAIIEILENRDLRRNIIKNAQRTVENIFGKIDYEQIPRMVKKYITMTG